MFVRPEEVVKSFELEPGMVVADFGCGSGYYSFAASKIVGRDGTVYAIDIQKDLLSALKSQAEINQMKNINIVWADLDVVGGSRLADNFVDFVIVSNILFQTENKEQLAREVFRILKNGGRVGVIEWKNKEVPQKEARNLFLNAGFKLEKEIQPGDTHYGIIFKKEEHE